MQPRLGVLVLVVIATLFGANHVAARVAIDHGASVAAAVGVRSGCTAIFLFAFLWAKSVPLEGGRGALWRVPAVGALVGLQSFCLYSAIAIIPVALALLVFQSFPLLYMLLSWAAGKETPPRRALVAMPLALVGLALALDVSGKSGRLAERWNELGAGCAWAFAASVGFTLVMFLNVHWLKGLDGRVRTFFMMAVTSILILGAGAAAGALALPADRIGWGALVLLTLLYGTAITSFFVLLPRLGGAAGTVALNFEPIAALAIAWPVLGQTIAPLQLLGAFVVVGAIVWLGRVVKPQR